jgi:predicted PolB exonuclease-like 3'-5' exonuclease
VHSYYHTGRIDEIKRYCESDVRALVDAATVLQDLAV